MHKTIQHIFFDLDHTLWDFEANSWTAFERMFRELNLEEKLNTRFEAFHGTYVIHNKHYWRLYAQQQISQADLRWKRMHAALLDHQHDSETLAKDMSHHYLQILPEGSKIFPDTHELLTYLKNKNYQIHILSNGFEQTQLQKLLFSNLSQYFDHVITSEKTGFVKPDANIFQYAFDLTGALKNQSIMIGDSPEADLQGALNAGIKSIFVNYDKIHTDVFFDYEVNQLLQIKEIL